MEKKKLTPAEKFLTQNRLFLIPDNEEGSPTQGRFIITLANLRLTEKTFKDAIEAARWVRENPVSLMLSIVEFVDTMKIKGIIPNNYMYESSGDSEPQEARSEE